MTSVKLVFENDIRRLKIDQSLDQPFEHISKIIRDSYALNDFELKYLDEEQDYCLIASEGEMKEALEFSNDKPLKLFIQKKATSLPQLLSSPSSELVHENIPVGLGLDKPESEPERLKSEPLPELKSEPRIADVKIPQPSLSEVKVCESTSKTVHEGIACDGCEVEPIQGLRYICTSCKCNLCSACESKNEHPQDHLLLKVKVQLPHDFEFSSPFPSWIQQSQHDPRLKAQFVRDVVSVNGTVKPTGDDQPLIPSAAPEIVDVSVKIQSPCKPGRFPGYETLPDISTLGRDVKNAFGKAFSVVSKALKGGPQTEFPEAKNSSQSSQSGPVPVLVLPTNRSIAPFKYQEQLDVLIGMGFEVEKSRNGLLTHKGNIEAVVNILV